MAIRHLEKEYVLEGYALTFMAIRHLEMKIIKWSITVFVHGDTPFRKVDAAHSNQGARSWRYAI